MDLTIFNDTDVNDKDARADFLLANALSHSQIGTVFEQRKQPIVAYPLTDVADEKDWLLRHNDVHQAEFALLGLTGMPNLADVDLTKQEQWCDWSLQHSFIHLYVNQALNITT